VRGGAPSLPTRNVADVRNRRARSLASLGMTIYLK
jgi:hypothetical protein